MNSLFNCLTMSVSLVHLNLAHIRMRLFPMWHCGLVSLEDENLDKYDVGEKPIQLIIEMMSQLQQLGKFLHSMGKVR